MRMTPPATPEPTRAILDLARQGDQHAWQILFEDCYPKIVRVARKRLSQKMRTQYDSSDIANEVMKSLAAKFDRFDFSSINGLRAFLVRAAEQKIVDDYRRGHAMKRDIGRDRPLLNNGSLGYEPADSSPTASQVAVATEEAEILLGGRAGVDRTVLELKLLGHTNSEVASATGWNLRKVERFLEKLRGTCRL